MVEAVIAFYRRELEQVSIANVLSATLRIASLPALCGCTFGYFHVRRAGGFKQNRFLR